MVIEIPFQFFTNWIRRAIEVLGLDVLEIPEKNLLRHMASTLIVIIDKAIVTTLAASGTSVISWVWSSIVMLLSEKW